MIKKKIKTSAEHLYEGIDEYLKYILHNGAQGMSLGNSTLNASASA